MLVLSRGRAAVLGFAISLTALPAFGQGSCVILRGGCGIQPNQCFPDALGPVSWTQPGGGRTTQWRFGAQSAGSDCHGAVEAGVPPRCCTSFHPPAGGPRPTVALRISGTRVFVDYEAPNYYCQNTGDWPPFFTCTNDPLVSSDQLVLFQDGEPMARAFPYYESGTWDTGVDVPCGESRTLTARLAFLAEGPLGVVEATATEEVTAACTDRRTCPAGGGGGAPSLGVGMPVHVGSGDVSLSLPLFSVAQAPLSLSFGLSYHSAVARRPGLLAAPLGPGWNHTFSPVLRSTDLAERFLYHVSGEGMESEYIRRGDGVWTAFDPGELRGSVIRSGGRLELADLDGTVTAFDAASGSWLSTTDRWGNALTGEYDGGLLVAVSDSMGRRIELRYSGGLLAAIELPGGLMWRFEYEDGLLVRIFDPLHTGSLPWRSFSYQRDSHGVPRLLAEVRDEAGALLEGHDYDASDRGVTSVSVDAAGGRDRVTVEHDTPVRGQTRVTHEIDASTRQVSVFTLAYQRGRFLPSRVEGNCLSCGGAGSDDQSFTYGPDNLVTSRTDGNGHVTRYEHDALANLTAITEAAGTPLERTVRYRYGDPSWPRFRTETDEPSAVRPGERKITRQEWRSGETVLVTTESGWLRPSDAAPTVYTRTTTFDARHRTLSVDGPRIDVADVTSFSYYPDDDADLARRGRLRAVTDAVGLTVSSADYDLFGTARRATDANGVATVRTTDGRGRVVSTVQKAVSGDATEAADYTVRHDFDGRDRLVRTVLPRGNGLRYGYEDGTERLVDEVRLDAAGREIERRHRTLDGLGSTVREELQSCDAPAPVCASWTTRRREDFVYDSHHRLSETRHPVPAGAAVRNTYDADGLLVAVQDENHASPNHLYSFDALHRLAAVEQSGTLTAYAYDARDNLVSVTDPNGNVTRYLYDDFGRLARQESPVTGVTTWEHDPAGQVVRSVDARGAVTTKTWDAAGRLLASVSALAGAATETVSQQYDDPTPGRYGLGRLARSTDPSGSTAWSYERRGLLRREEKTVQGSTFATSWRYDANGNRVAMVYPTGREVTQGFDFADRPGSAALGGAPLVSSASYLPFGPAERVVFGNGTVQTRTWDLRYRPVENRLDGAAGVLSDHLYGLDAVGNVTSLRDALDPAYDRTFAYDDLYRLTGASTGDALWGSGSYSYDAMGNMTSLALGSFRSARFAYDGRLPKLTGVETAGGLRPVTYDAAGNETGSGEVWSARNLLAAADGLSYLYDGRGLRVATAIDAPFGTATGTVVADVTGAPIPGATVRVTGTVDGTATDGAGAFRLTRPAGIYTLTASAPGYLPATSAPFALTAGGETPVGTLRLALAPGRITGTVTGSVDGAPLAGVWVTVAGSFENVYTDESGIFNLELPAGTWTLTLSRPGYLGRTLDPVVLAAGAVRRLGSLELEAEPATLTGRAVDSSGAGIAGAAVSASPQSLRASGPETVTGPDGRFALSVPPGTWSLAVSRDGFGSRQTAAVDVGPGGSYAFGDLLLQALGTVTGRVVRSADGTAIAGATVAVDGTLGVVGTDAAGAFRLSLPPGTYTVTASAQGFAPRTSPPFPVTPGGALDLGNLALSEVALSVHVGYADDLRPTSVFPVPWQGAPNVVYLGSPSPLDAGAVRLDNSTDQPIAVDRVVVDLQRPGPVYDLWGSFTVPPHGSVVLTQTQPFNFDTSDAAIVACGATPPPGDPRVPKVTVVIGGQPTSYYDAGHVLDTGGFDSYCRGNESLAWRLIGTAGADTGGDFLLEPAIGTGSWGEPYTLTATVRDAGGQPLPNVAVTFRAASGPNRGATAQAVTGPDGRAIHSYTSAYVGADTWEANIPNPSGGAAKSNLAAVRWPSPIDLELFLGYADNESGSAPGFPQPWQGDPGILFLGGGQFLDAGALRIDNPTDEPLPIDRVTVDLQRSIPIFDLWGSFTIPPHQSAILTQTRSYDFDTSEFPIMPCGVPAPQDDPRVPKITVHSRGKTFSYLDSEHVLDTFGYDLRCRKGESMQWRPVGASGAGEAGKLFAQPRVLSGPVGSVQTITAVLVDAAGEPQPGVFLFFQVYAGNNRGHSGGSFTDSAGIARFSYASTVEAFDTLRVRVQNATIAAQEINGITIDWVPKATLTLSPASTTLPVGSAANLSVVAKRPDGRLLPGLAVVFRVTAGPDAGKTFRILTDSTGKAAYTFSGKTEGTDTIEASILMGNGTWQTSNPATVTWTAPKTLSLTPYSAVHAPGETASMTAALSQPLGGVAVTFRVVSGPTVGRTGQGVTDSTGRASFSYAGTVPGVDTVQATATVNGDALSSNLAAVEWTSIATTLIYTGAQSGEYSDPMHLAARLTESATGQPLAGRTLAFVLGSQTATAVTGSDGSAAVDIVPNGLPGATPLSVTFAAEGAWSGSATSRLAVITPEDTVLTLAGVSAIASGIQPVTARLLDDDGQPVVGRTIVFKLGTATAQAMTDATGTATATLTVPVLATGTARLEASFGGDAWYRPSSAAATVLQAQPTSFVVWGGNTPGLRPGDRVQFWGAQWSRQVRGGDYAAQADFKGWTNAPLPLRLCQPDSTTTGTPRLDATCWTAKPGNSNPPAKLGSYIQVIVATSIAKSGSTIYGNIAGTLVLQTEPGYAPDPGHPAYGTVIAVLEGASHREDSQEIKRLAAATAPQRRISLYTPELSLMAETELTTAARPAILYEYIWFDGKPLAQVDRDGTVSWTFTDHLGTPLLQTSALQGIVWQAEHEPYGAIYELRSYDRHQPLRFPGQESEQLGTGANGVTDRSYNIHRWYRSEWGRYTQADPLGRRGDPHPFSYARSRPLFYVDPFGLVTDSKDCSCCTRDQAWKEHEQAGIFLLKYWPYYAWTPARIWRGGSCLTAATDLYNDLERVLAPKCWVTSIQLIKAPGANLSNLITGTYLSVHYVVKQKPCACTGWTTEWKLDAYIGPTFEPLPLEEQISEEEF